ncbi:hypothetical protein L2E82_40337 [Cichorium intybus]|uniref:Uncharacterized protein n=1 Tax=Cichorium intybus TaxID=13427 RepID=A0ACB9AKI5_CICIN|nr:hypothetical protein L2E82_40337 [Cichorium intybus]
MLNSIAVKSGSIHMSPDLSQTQKLINELEKEIASLEAENTASSRTLELRKKQFALLLHVVNELQNTIEKEQNSIMEEMRMAIYENKCCLVAAANLKFIFSNGSRKIRMKELVAFGNDGKRPLFSVVNTTGRANRWESTAH